MANRCCQGSALGRPVAAGLMMGVCLPLWGVAGVWVAGSRDWKLSLRMLECLAGNFA